jgi:TPR repeat protein
MTVRLIFALALAAAAPVGAQAGAQAVTRVGAPATDPIAIWNSGDFPRAVEAARAPAAAGDADAQFLLGQAYRLGRGVTADPATALGWYRRAAAQGHVAASDSLGLLLFAQGQRAEAMPLLVQSSDRGEPRALYLVATAHFNGDYVTKDWPLAYAMMSRAAEAGIVQARQSLATMERYLTPTDKGKAQALIAAQRASTPPAASATNVAAAQTRPAPPPPVAKPPVARTNVAAATPKPTVTRPAPTPAKPTTAPAPRGNWRVQLGAFGSADRAETAWASLAGKNGDLAALDHKVVTAGSIRRLQAGGIASREAANALCRRIIAAGGGCIPIAP